MSPFRRRPRALPMPFPRLDRSTWPDRRDVGRPSFAVSTLYALAQQEAFTPGAHDVTDLVLQAVLPMLWTGAAPEDEGHMRRVCAVAAQLGAGVGIVEQRSVYAGEGMDPEAAAVLRLAAGSLPTMPPHQQDVALYLLQCGYYLARTGPEHVPELVAALFLEEHPAVRLNG